MLTQAPGKEDYKTSAPFPDHRGDRIRFEDTHHKTLGVIGSVEESRPGLFAPVGKAKTSVLGAEIAYLKHREQPSARPPAINGFKACKAVMPRAVTWACSIHIRSRGITLYPVPYELYESTKSGATGSTHPHRYVAGKAAELLGRRDAKITRHLGNGSSITATKTAGRWIRP
ncbi:MAG: hypothetical protein ACLRSW_07135 [Christensenellaceae bacterium]